MAYTVVNGEVVAKQGRCLQVDISEVFTRLIKEMEKRGVL